MPNIPMNVFENIAIKSMISHRNVCAADWCETDCVYGYNKFYYFLDGECTLILQGDEYHPAPEELYLIPADVRHSYWHNPNKPVYQYWCHFDLTLNEGKKLQYSQNATRCKVSRETMEPLFQKLIQSGTRRSPLDTLMEKRTLMEMLQLFLENTEDMSNLPANADDFATKIDDFIHRNLQSRITLQQLAETAHLHPNYFIQYFKKHFNVSPMEHINVLRLERAAQLLTNRCSIADAAALSGFNDYRYFSRLFRKRYGMTPSAYRDIHYGMIGEPGGTDRCSNRSRIL